MIYTIKFSVKTWKIGELIKFEEAGRLDLQPHYQRNAIWSASAQRDLVSTIKSGYPIPNIFVRERSDGRYEVVDGQQRCRAIISYYRGDLKDDDGVILNRNGNASGKQGDEDWIKAYVNYPLLVSVIDNTLSDKEIEDFYVTVNSTGVKLNTAELRKAAHYHTEFLALANQIADLPTFQALALFSDKSTDRMNDIDFISELLSFLIHGHTDKKLKLTEIYESDIDKDKSKRLYREAEAVLGKISLLNAVIPLKRTRFKQKNDFYTLFAYIHTTPDIDDAFLQYAYRAILRLSKYISPSQENCEPLREYALNCVSQSNSKKAREARALFFDALFNNTTATPNSTQISVVKFLGAEISTGEAFVQMRGRFVLSEKILSAAE